MPLVRMTVKIADVSPANTNTAAPPDAFTVTAPVELLLIKNVCPRDNVLVTGNVTVWVVEPVKNCCSLLAAVRTVVPAAVTVVV